ncbi:hypothetical protein BT96DRAFT_1014987, partial [Gymnopus androsaceus JB14]
MIPNELVDCILEKLYFDTKTLLNSWHLPPYHSRIPPAFRFDDNFHLDLCERLVAIFNANPRLALYVQSLQLLKFDGDDEAFYTAAANVIRRLSNVNRLSLLFVDWQALPSLLKTALTEMFRAPSLTQVSLAMFTIHSFAELASLLSYMTHLKVLEITTEISYHHDLDLPDNTPSELDVGVIGHAANHPSILEKLHLHSSLDTVMSWLQQDACPIDVRNLQSLEIDTRADIGTLLQYVGSSLTELKLRQVSPRNYNYLEYTPNLRSLLLVLGNQSHNGLLWIQDLFKHLLNAKGNRIPLKHLTILLNVDRDPLPTAQSQLDHWASIDELLQNTQ